MTGKFKLTIELVPEKSWHNNLRSLLPKDAWDKLRHQVSRDYHHKCGICNSTGKLDCHEVWKYDDACHIQKLTGLIALCNLCHRVKHIGLAQLQAGQGKLDFDVLTKHFMQVNNCTRQDFETERKKALEIWAERSKYDWQLDIGEYQNVASLI